MKAFKLLILLFAVTLLGACGKKSGSKPSLNRSAKTGTQQEALSCSIQSDPESDKHAFCLELARKMDRCENLEISFEHNKCSEIVSPEDIDAVQLENKKITEPDADAQNAPEDKSDQDQSKESQSSDEREYKVSSIEAGKSTIYVPAPSVARPTERPVASPVSQNQDRAAQQYPTTTRPIFERSNETFNPSAPVTTAGPSDALAVIHPPSTGTPTAVAQAQAQQQAPVAQAPVQYAPRTQAPVLQQVQAQQPTNRNIIFNRCYVVQDDRYLPGENPCYPRNEEVARDTVTGEQLLEQTQQAQNQAVQQQPVQQQPVQQAPQAQQPRQEEPVQQNPVQQEQNSQESIRFVSNPVVQPIPGQQQQQQPAQQASADQAYVVVNRQPLPQQADDSQTSEAQSEPLPAVTEPVTAQTVEPAQTYRVIEAPTSLPPQISDADADTIAIATTDRRRQIPSAQSTTATVDQQASSTNQSFDQAFGSVASQAQTAQTVEPVVAARTTAIPVGTACYRLDVANFVAYELNSRLTLTSNKFKGKYSSWADEVCKLRDRKKSDWNAQLSSRGYNAPISASDRAACADELLAVATACEMDVREGVSTSDNIK